MGGRAEAGQVVCVCVCVAVLLLARVSHAHGVLTEPDVAHRDALPVWEILLVAEVGYSHLVHVNVMVSVAGAGCCLATDEFHEEPAWPVVAETGAKLEEFA
ncbi:hypothetical protein C8R43DRAFT_1036207 [Mycena crocata]|nr:hypothetical protein C8R43DRAFT_1036207 [Mycena crocata]